MAKSESTMRPTDVDPMEFIAGVEHAGRRQDAVRLVQIMREVTGEEPVMWGPSIVGFGSYHYVYASGREGDAPLAAFSPCKANLVVYPIGGYQERYPEQLAALGPYKPGNACLYLRRLEDVDEEVLRFLIKDSLELTRAEYA